MCLRWSIPKPFLDSPEVEYRNALFRTLSKRPVEEIALHCTSMSVHQMTDFLETVLQAARINLRGVGVEAGAGSGLVSAICAKNPAVSDIYAVEVSLESPRLVIPKVAKHVLGSDASKVIPVFGTFDELGLDDESVDFVIELHSYHHSHDLRGTLREAARVLKPGGLLLCLDRVQPNSMTDDEVEALLSITYSREFLRQNCYPEDIIMTRRENGEHEYRLREWESAFESAGLQVKSYHNFGLRIGFKSAFAGIVASLIPGAWKKGQLKRRSLKHTKTWLRQNILKTEIAAPRETGFFVLSKPIDRVSRVNANLQQKKKLMELESENAPARRTMPDSI